MRQKKLKTETWVARIEWRARKATVEQKHTSLGCCFIWSLNVVVGKNYEKNNAEITKIAKDVVCLLGIENSFENSEKGNEWIRCSSFKK